MMISRSKWWLVRTSFGQEPVEAGSGKEAEELYREHMMRPKEVIQMIVEDRRHHVDISKYLKP
ncbi:hypothetical protein vBSlqSZDD2_66 [Serratia phage vB_SlqS_ZDD2]|nr:hypothetical protein vBSlqSZDD2_66 [Serratia phage vB_SlqS_ZDD2]